MSKLRVDELESLATGRTVSVDNIDTGLREDLANPDKGAAMVARGMVAVDSVAGLLALSEGQRKEGLRYLVKGYHAGSDVGGGEFYWDETKLKPEHDGGHVIDPNKSFPSDWSDNSSVSSWLGEFGVGNGCFVRVQTSGDIELETFGAVGDGSTDNGLISNFALALGFPVILARGINLISTTVELDYIGASIRGRGLTDVVVPSLTGVAFLMLARSTSVTGFKATNYGPEAEFLASYTPPESLVVVGGEGVNQASQCQVGGILTWGLKVTRSFIRHRYGFGTNLRDISFQTSRAEVAAFEVNHTNAETPSFAYAIVGEELEFTSIYREVDADPVPAIRMEGGDMSLREIIIQGCGQGIVIGGGGRNHPILSIDSLYFEANRGHLFDVLSDTVPNTAPFIKVSKMRETGGTTRHTYNFGNANIGFSNIWASSLNASKVVDSNCEITIDTAGGRYDGTRQLAGLQVATVKWAGLGVTKTEGVSNPIRYFQAGPNKNATIRISRTASASYQSKVQVYSVLISGDGTLVTEQLSSIDGGESEKAVSPDFTFSYDGENLLGGISLGGSWQYSFL